MRVLAVDPGYERCGVAILEQHRGAYVLVYSDCIQTPASDPFPQRLHAIITEYVRLIDMYTPDMVALERLYFNTNQKTAMAVAEVRGALMYCTTSKNVPLHEYTPAQIKMAVTSWGKATKHDVTNMVRRLIRIEKEIRYDDEYDAIALGITHLAHMRHGI